MAMKSPRITSIITKSIAVFAGVALYVAAHLFTVGAYAQTPPSITLSVPAGTELEEGDGNTTVTVTATLNQARTSNTVITLTLGGSAKSTDYTVVQNPVVTIADGQTTGSADLILRPVDDSFYEGQEFIEVAGAADGVTVSNAEIPLIDSEQKPSLSLRSTRKDSDRSSNFKEGESATLVITLDLQGAVLESATTGTIKHAAGLTYGPNYHSAAEADYYYVEGSATRTRTFTFPKNSVRHSFEIPITIVDDEDREINEIVYVDVKLEVSSTVSIDAKRLSLASIDYSDQPTIFELQCSESEFYAGESTDIDCRVRAINSGSLPTKNYSITYTAEDAAKVDPDSMTFEVQSGQRESSKQTIEFLYDSTGAQAVNNAKYTAMISPSDEISEAGFYTFTVYGPADPTFQVNSFSEGWSTNTAFTVGSFVYTLSFWTPFPVNISGGSKRMDIQLDSGLSFMDCHTPTGAPGIICRYKVQSGDYDFDGTLVIPTGAVKFTQWCSQRNPAVCGSVVNPLPSEPVPLTTHRGNIYGGTFAIELTVSPKTFQEGESEQELEVLATNAAEIPWYEDIVIPLKFIDISTSSGDYSIRGTQSVTIPANQKTATLKGLFITPVNDFTQESDVEILHLTGDSDAAMENFVRPVELRILDAAGIKLSSSSTEIAEDSGQQQIVITAEWGDSKDTVLAKDLDIELQWSGSAGAGDYTRSGGNSVTIPANAQSGTATVSITPTDDKLLEGDETIVISGSAPGRSIASASLILEDDEETPAVTIKVNPDSFNESAPDSNITVSAAFDPGVAMATNETTLTINLAGTAKRVDDYAAAWIPANRQIKIQPQSLVGDNTVNIFLDLVDDQVSEPEETIVVEGTATAGGESLVVKVATITITDDDELGINLDPLELKVDEGAKATYEVWLGTKPIGDVTVSLSSTDANVAKVEAAADQSQTLTFTPTDWNDKQVVTVNGVEDDRNNVDDKRTAEIRHTTTGGGYDDVEEATLAVTVTDNDEASSFSVGDASETEGNSLSFTVSRAGAKGDSASVEWNTAEDTDGTHAAASTDYTEQTTAQVLNFSAGDTEKTITVLTAQDALDEYSETFLVKLSSPSTGTSISDDTATGTITDDDPTTVTLARAGSGFIDEAGGSEEITITLGRALETGESVTVPLTVTGATVTTHYTLALKDATTGVSLSTANPHSAQNPAVTLSGNGLTEATLTLTAVETTDTTERTASVAYGSGTRAPTAAGLDGGITPSGSPVTVPIADNDAQISVEAASAAEGDAVEFEVTLPRAAPASGVTVDYATSDGRGNADDETYQVATSTADYTAAAQNASITIAAGDTAGTISIATADDTTYESDHYFTLTLTGSSRMSTAGGSAIGTITDAGDLPVIAFASATGSVAENAGAASVTASRTGASLVASTVGYATADGTAEAGSDYTAAAADSELSFASGETGKTISVAIANDVLHEGNETFEVTLSGVTHATLGSAATHEVTITDDDAAPTAITLSVDADTGTNNIQSSISEGGGAKTVRVTATITSATRFAEDKEVTVEIGHADDSATEGTDYTQVGTLTITIAAGEESGHADFTLTPDNDVIDEANESIAVKGSLSGVTFTDTAIGLDDDDAAPTAITLSVDADTGENGVQSSVSEGGGAKTVRVTATITSATRFAEDKEVTVEIGHADDSATEGTDYTEVDDLTITVDAGKASGHVDFTLTPDNDVIDEADESIAVNGTLSGVTVAGTAIVLADDDDAPSGIRLSTSPSAVAEDGGETEITVTAAVEGGTTYSEEKTVTVEVGDASDSADEGTDYGTVGRQTFTIAAGSAAGEVEFDLTPTNDGTDEPREVITVDGSVTGETVHDSQIILTDDDPTTVTLARTTSGFIDEAGGSEEITITLGRALETGESVTVPLTVTGATVTTHYTLALKSAPAGVSLNTSSLHSAQNPAVTLSGNGLTEATLTLTAVETTDTTERTASVAYGSGTRAPTAAGLDGGITPSGSPVTVPIADNDAQISVEAASAAEGDAVEFEVTLPRAAPASGVTVDYATSDGRGNADDETYQVATSTADYTAAAQNASITIAAGDTAGTISIATADDTTYESDHYFTLTLTGSSRMSTAGGSAIGTITDAGDLPVIAFASATGSVAENAGAASVTASRTGASLVASTVGYATADGTAEAGSDYTAAAADSELSFASGETGKTISVAIANDVLHEGNETFEVTLSGVTHATLGSAATHEVTITDDDAAPTAITLSVDADTGTNNIQSSISEGGGAKTVRVTATITSATRFAEDKEVTVEIGHADDSATEGTDYTQVGTLTITIAAGEESGHADFTLTPDNDVIDEANESIAVKGSLSGVTFTDTAIGLDDDDAAPTAITLSVDADTGENGVQSSVSEGGGAKTVRVTATITSATRFAEDKEVTVEIGHADDSATEGTDYTEVDDLTITVDAGKASGHVDFTLTPDNDVIDEADESIAVDGTLSGVTVTGTTIGLDDDDERGVTVTGTSLTVAEIDDAGTSTTAENEGTYTVVLLTEPTDDVVISVTVPAGAPFTASPSSLTFTPGGAGIWSTPQEVTVTALNDDLDNSGGSRSAMITHTLNAGSSDYGGVSAGAVSVTVTDDDEKGVTVSKASLTIDEVDDTATENTAENVGTYTVVLTSEPTANVVISVTVPNGAPFGASPSSLTFTPSGTGIWNAPQTVTVTALDDNIDNNGGSRSAAITHTLTVGSSDYAGVTADPVSVTVSDDDGAPSGIRLSVDTDSDADGEQTNLSESASATTVTVTATVIGGTTYAAAQTVAVSVGGGTATSVDDYAAVSNFSITIPAGQSSHSATFSLAPVSDSLHEGDETIEIDGTLQGINITDAELTITDDDAAPTMLRLVVDADSSTNPVETSLSEGGGAKTFSVTAEWGDSGSSRLPDAVVIALTWAGTATSEDYTRSGGATVTIAAGARSGSVTAVITPQDDSLLEGDETIEIRGTTPGRMVKSAEVMLTDDETVPAVTIEADLSALSESGSARTVTISAVLDPTVAMANDVTTLTLELGGSAVEGTDYGAGWLPASRVITIPHQSTEGSNTVSLTLTPTDDAVVEGNETIVVQGTATTQSRSLVVEVATIRLVDDDARGVNLDPPTMLNVPEAGTATYEVWLGSQPTSSVTVSLASGDSNIAQVDHPVLTFSPSNYATRQTVTVSGVDDDLDNAEDRRETTVTHTATGGGYNDVEAVILAVTVDDNDEASSFSISDGSANEGEPISFTVTRSSASGAAATVDWNTADDADGDHSAAADDYSVQSAAQSLSFGVGEKTKTFSVNTAEDSLDEEDETFLVQLSGQSSGTEIAQGTATGTIVDDDDAPNAITLTVDADTGTNNVQSSVSEGAGAKTVRVTATITSSTRFADSKQVSVMIGKTNDSAEEGEDYTAVADQFITIDAGKASGSVEFMLTPTNDVIDEGNEVITIESTEADITYTNTAITITDDDDPPSAITLSVDADTGTNNVQSSLAEAGGAKTVRVTATVGGSTTFGAPKTVTVKIGKSADSATSGSDYTAVADQTISIPAGSSSAHVDFTVTPTNDAIHEGDETISIEGTLSGVTVTGTSMGLTDDETLPVVTLVLTPSTINESGAANASTVTATMNPASSAAVTLTVAAVAVAPAVAGDVTLSGNKTLTIAAGARQSSGTVTITAVDNAVDAPNKTVTVSATATGGNGVAAPATQTLTITDDDGAPSAITLSVDADTGTNNVQSSLAEAGGAKTVRVTATVGGSTTFGAPKTVTVKIGKSADSATSGSDYTAVADQTISIPAGSSSAHVDFTVTPTNDAIHEGDETISIEGTLSGVTVTGTSMGLTDDETLPVVTLVLTPSTINESGAANASTVTATMNPASSAAVTLTVAAVAVAPAVAGDVTLSGNKTLTIAAGARQSSGTVTITAVDNAVDAPNKTVTVSATATGGNGVAAPATQTLTITDDDGAPSAITLSVDADTGTNNVQSSLAEAGGAKTVRVTATVGGSTTFGAPKTVTVKIGKSADSATSGSDYTAVADQTISIPAGSSSAHVDFTVTPTNDAIHEGDETISIEGTLSGVTVTGTSMGLTDDETLPVVTLVLTPSTINESGAANASTVTATMNPASSAAVTLTVAAVAVAPAVAGDVTLSGNKTLTIAAGARQSSGTVTITAVDNAVDAPNKTVTVSATATGGNGVAAPATQTLTITDDDGAPSAITLSVDADTGTNNVQSSLAEAGGAKTVRVTATVGGSTTFGAPKTVTVKIGKSADSATSGSDYTAVADQTISIPAGSSSAHVDFTVTPTNDAIHEGDETISIEGTLSGVTVTGTSMGLTDDETLPVVTLVLTPSTINESGAANASTVTATMNPASSAAVTLTVAAVAVAPAVAGDVTLSGNKTLTIAAGARQSSGTVTITAVDNAVDAPNKTVTVSATATGGNGVAAPATQTLTITDDDATENPKVSVSDAASVLEGDNPSDTTNMSFTVSLSQTSTDAVKVSYTLGGSAKNGTDYTAPDPLSITIAAGASSASIDIPIRGDTIDEGNETVVVTLTAADNADISDAQGANTASGTITDDDVSVNPALGEIYEGETLTFTVSGINSQFTAVQIETASAGTAVRGTDYRLLNAGGSVLGTTHSITVSKGSITFQVEALTDSNDTESDETIVLLIDDSTDTLSAALGTLTLKNGARPVAGVSVGPLNLTLTEGGASGSYSVVLTKSPQADSTVTVTAASNLPSVVKVAASGDEPADSTSLSFTDENWNTAQTITVTPQSDADTKDTIATISHSVSGSGEYQSVTADSVSVTVEEPEKPAVSVSISDAKGMEGQKIRFEVALSAPSPGSISVNWQTHPRTAEADIDYSSASGQLVFAQGQQRKFIQVSIKSDNTDEPNEYFTVELSGAQNASIVRSTALGLIMNQGSLPSQWNARFGRTVAEHLVDAVTDRIEQDLSPGLTGTVAGAPLKSASDSHGTDYAEHCRRSASSEGSPSVGRLLGSHCETIRIETRVLNRSELLRGTEFSLTETDTGGGNYSIWGRGFHSRFDGEGTGFVLDGTVDTAVFGIDWTDDEWRSGVALSLSDGSGRSSARNTTADEISSTITALTPWASIDLSDEMTVWIAASVGSGDLKIDSGNDISVETDMKMTMAAAGMHRRIIDDAASQGFTLNLKSDVFLVRTNSKRAEGLRASLTEASRFRLGLQGEWSDQSANDAIFTRQLEIGVRHDDGDAEKGFGVEIAGGIGWQMPRSGIETSLSAHTLVAHGDEAFRNWGVSVQFVFDPRPTSQYGFSTRLGHDAGGSSAGGFDHLFAHGSERHAAEDLSARNWHVGVTYGFAHPHRPWVLIPYLDYRQGTASVEHGFGLRIMAANRREDEFSLDIRATQTKRGTSPAVNGIRLDLRAYW